ncbi:MAG: group II intron maturase-specific domain-containing protein [Bacillota bacterium]|nr:group II intron maturase-specific domain-containing protein [Bacillota bacterium]MDW7678255.1 group II intron maturase-specific domain-containing protein [Bacillota bacterium]
MIDGEVRFKVPADRVKRLKNKIRKLTSRKWSVAMEYRLHKLAQLMRGWVQYYKMANMKKIARNVDQWTRRRLRAVRWKEWKKIRTKHDNLVRLGIDNSKAWEYANSRKKFWRISSSWILTKTLTNQYWLSQGYKDFSSYYLSVKIDVS